MNKVTIDFNIWCTQADYARYNDMKLATISQWVKRAKEGKTLPKIEYMDIPQLSMTLVKKS